MHQTLGEPQRARKKWNCVRRFVSISSWSRYGHASVSFTNSFATRLLLGIIRRARMATKYMSEKSVSGLSTTFSCQPCSLLRLQSGYDAVQRARLPPPSDVLVDRASHCLPKLVNSMYHRNPGLRAHDKCWKASNTSSIPASMIGSRAGTPESLTPYKVDDQDK